ncbi:type VI secretion system PAAR protein [Salmonella enterica]|uniref:type VI secretion system PAAR protein n=1 Tax=Salmonella enterica TaxID=28901 RepID=UPI001012FE53|nr:type VI secretion system PAAR protein [Salmonella enterica]EDS4738510.1 type VI secretion system PAAR protein [Salmonella enterica subsp. enterica serovar Oranienburg]EDU6362784.1 type VI secretion system PAAR protein [Salmonella enterica subsp. enterica serovar Florian]EGX8054679.1 type VI secretion system PAAR protein [Salmonella enterica subsp. enterica serovar Inganda]EHM3440498.1 type VI secretion system PAAR protein [Salmonella enterica subsp. enterica]EAS1760890.1 type VI secretion s
MPTAARLNDKGTQHDSYYETVIITSSLMIFIDRLPVARMGGPLTPHSKPEHPPHPRKIAGGSSTAFIDDLPAARTGDGMDCDGVVIGGGTVNTG